MNDLWQNVMVRTDVPMSDEDIQLADIVYAREAEMATLGAILIQPGNLWTLPLPDDFYDWRHKQIAEAFMAIAKTGGVIDSVTVADELRRMGSADEIGGIAYLLTLENATFDERQAEQYANIVRRRALLKRWWMLNLEAVKRFWQPGQQPDTLFAWLRDELETLLTGATPTSDRARTTLSATYDSLGRYEERKAAFLAGIPLGWGVPFAALGKHIEHLEPNALTIIYGEGGVGKTSLMYQWHEEYQRLGYRGAFYQFEMSDEAVDNARQVRLSSVPLSVVRNGNGTEEQEQRLSKVADEVAQWAETGYLINAAGMDIDTVVMDLERRHKVDGLQYFDIDHMKMLLENPSPRQVRAKMNETQIFGDNIRKLKGVCNRTGMRGFVAHHPNAQGKLYSSTDLQNLVDVIIHLEAENAETVEMYPGTNKPVAKAGELSWWVKFTIEKQKMGGMVSGHLFFERPYFRFRKDVLGKAMTDE